MQNDLRRPGGDSRRGPHQDVERQATKSHGGPRFTSEGVQAHFIAMTGEFVGTFMFLFFAFAATQIANTLTPAAEPRLDQLLFISLAFGFSLAVTAWVFYRYVCTDWRQPPQVSMILISK